MKITLLTLMLLFAGFCNAQTVTTKYKCYFLKESTDLNKTDVLTVGELKQGTIPANKELAVLGLDTCKYVFYKVKYKDRIGYIHKDVVTDNSLILSKDPNIRDEFRKCVIEHSVAIGMTKYEVLASLGKPLEINATVTVAGLTEQLCFGNVINHYYVTGFTLQNVQTTSDRKYIYIENGIVTSFKY